MVLHFSSYYGIRNHHGSEYLQSAADHGVSLSHSRRRPDDLRGLGKGLWLRSGGNHQGPHRTWARLPDHLDWRGRTDLGVSSAHSPNALAGPSSRKRLIRWRDQLPHGAPKVVRSPFRLPTPDMGGRFSPRSGHARHPSSRSTPDAPRRLMTARLDSEKKPVGGCVTRQESTSKSWLRLP